MIERRYITVDKKTYDKIKLFGKFYSEMTGEFMSLGRIIKNLVDQHLDTFKEGIEDGTITTEELKEVIEQIQNEVK